LAITEAGVRLSIFYQFAMLGAHVALITARSIRGG
jgi:hypothetical protein